MTSVASGRPASARRSSSSRCWHPTPLAPVPCALSTIDDLLLLQIMTSLGGILEQKLIDFTELTQRHILVAAEVTFLWRV